ncbi:Gfo/Idh/MocA family oxidoreductase [Microbacterium sp. Bi121]|uniref:Gfo/Idh/MocA family protein n=1 Tax=Microbacterium sp. Bi121 TaxID=2822348 RepID=UPI001D1C4E70|nr:Gfo/Idh/MocA family oxidoreductase [Microbacterium sp. Bi121]CAH0123201.1 1,5-anhydro-D-fructose reductase [Microbacterium sp. Bi121]
MGNIRWGIVGCGDVTEVKSGPALQKADGSELVAVMRRTPHLAEDYARRHGVPRWSDDADAIIRADDIDVVYIATHPDTHLHYAERAAEAGKAVYVEKPMARSADECRRMQDACDRAGVPLWVAYYRRALPRFRKIKTLIDDGAIGDIRAVASRRYQRVRADAWQNTPGASGGGYFFDAACHTLDFLQFLFGPIEHVNGLASSHGAIGPLEDTVTASYRFADGVIGSGTWCFDSADDEDVTTVIGSAGTLSFSVSAHAPIRLVRRRQAQEYLIDDPAHAHLPLVQTIVDELRGRGTCPSTGRSALATAEAIDAILADVRSRTLDGSCTSPT